MIVTAIKTNKILPNAATLTQVVDQTITALAERSVVVVTSKIVSLCENRIVAIENTDREALIRDESDLYYEPDSGTSFLYKFTITNNTLIPAAGIDSSNGNDNYILWPKDPQASANALRRHLMQRFGVKNVGVIITDSTIGLSRWGTLGIAIAHSGFAPVKNYVGKKDVFGRELLLSKANVAGGLASAAVVAMGEGAEQTPLALIEDVPFVDFATQDPSPEECAQYYISPLVDEPFRPFFESVKWRPGGKPSQLPSGYHLSV